MVGISVSPSFFRKEIMTEELFWKRSTNLWKMIHSIEDDLVYRVMWEEKLKELMKKGVTNEHIFSRQDTRKISGIFV